MIYATIQHMTEIERIKPKQRVFREVIRNVGHPLVFKNKTELIDPEGLSRFHEILREGHGGVVVETHFSALDPMWTMNAVTKQMGVRDIHISGPIRIDRTNPTFNKVMHWAGVDITGIVTPKAYVDAVEKGNPKGFKPGQGLEKYFTQAIETIKAGGLVVIASNPERQAKLTLDEHDSVAGLLHLLKSRRLVDFGVHFVSPSLKNTTDYSKHRSIPTVLRRAYMRHGATFTAGELWSMAESEVDPDLDRKAKRDATNREISKIIFSEFLKIVPPGMKPTAQ